MFKKEVAPAADAAGPTAAPARSEQQSKSRQFNHTKELPCHQRRRLRYPTLNLFQIFMIITSLLLYILSSDSDFLLRGRRRSDGGSHSRLVSAFKLRGLIYNKDGKFIYRPSKPSQGHIIIIENRDRNKDDTSKTTNSDSGASDGQLSDKSSQNLNPTGGQIHLATLQPSGSAAYQSFQLISPSLVRIDQTPGEPHSQQLNVMQNNQPLDRASATSIRVLGLHPSSSSVSGSSSSSSSSSPLGSQELQTSFHPLQATFIRAPVITAAAAAPDPTGRHISSSPASTQLNLQPQTFATAALQLVPIHPMIQTNPHHPHYRFDTALLAAADLSAGARVRSDLGPTSSMDQAAPPHYLALPDHTRMVQPHQQSHLLRPGPEADTLFESYESMHGYGRNRQPHQFAESVDRVPRFEGPSSEYGETQFDQLDQALDDSGDPRRNYAAQPPPPPYFKKNANEELPGEIPLRVTLGPNETVIETTDRPPRGPSTPDKDPDKRGPKLPRRLQLKSKAVNLKKFVDNQMALRAAQQDNNNNNKLPVKDAKNSQYWSQFKDEYEIVN